MKFKYKIIIGLLFGIVMGIAGQSFVLGILAFVVCLGIACVEEQIKQLEQ